MAETACGAEKLFVMGHHAVATVQCAQFSGHAARVHETVDRGPNGASITYRWPVEESP